MVHFLYATLYKLSYHIPSNCNDNYNIWKIQVCLMYDEHEYVVKSSDQHQLKTAEADFLVTLQNELQ